mmetsp:Transcript_7301/g.9251  ORF Transcript_7301/g.9251 Transcript_7301/m.9251 type:complete len:421 (-) Transcript_7301:498-1760(-)
MSGKREIKFDGANVFSSKKFLSGPFEHPFSLPGSSGNKPLSVKIEEGRDGYAYDLLINRKLFQRHTRISIMDFEDLRKQLKRERAQAGASEVKKIGYGDFVQKDTSNLDGAKYRSDSNSIRKSSDEDIFSWSNLTEKPSVATRSPSDHNPNASSTFSPFDDGPVVNAKPLDTSELFNPFDGNVGQENASTPPFDLFSSPITMPKPSASDYDNYFTIGSHHRNLEVKQSAPAGLQALDQTYSDSLNSVTAGLDSLDFSANYPAQPTNTSYRNPPAASSSSFFHYSPPNGNGNTDTSQQNNPLDSLVNLDTIKSTSSTPPAPQSTSTAYRFQYGNRNGMNSKTYSQTAIAPQQQNGYTPSLHNYNAAPGEPFQQPLQPDAAPLQPQQYQQPYQRQPYPQQQYQQPYQQQQYQQPYQQQNPFT